MLNDDDFAYVREVAAHSTVRFSKAMLKERDRQLKKWGVQTCGWVWSGDGAHNYADEAQDYKDLNDLRAANEQLGYWDAILLEEVYEVLEALQAGDFEGAKKELDEVAAVCASMFNQIERECPPEEPAYVPECGDYYAVIEKVRGIELRTGTARCMKPRGHGNSADDDGHGQ